MKHFSPSLFRKSNPGGNRILQWLVYNQFISFLSPRLVPARIVAVLLILFTSIQAQAQEVLVGLTSDYGPQGGGTAFSLKTNGTGFAVHKTFTKLGFRPKAELIQAKDGNFYGMTSGGGTANFGTIFKMTPAGKVTTFFNFTGFDGNAPEGNNLIQAKDGNFYGMTSSGGLNNGGAEPGVVFRITPGGEYKVIYTFIRHQGYRPYGDLLEGPDGNFYGMTYYGGTFDKGTIFKLTPTGTHTIIHEFNGTSRGGYPAGSLVLGNDGNFYGMATTNGFYNYGTIFKITPSGTFTLLHSFEQSTGGTPVGSLVKHSDGNFYGVTQAGGNNYAGVIFRITPAGAYKVVHHFGFDDIGTTPRRSLMRSKDGYLYGTTTVGGYHGFGTIFKITTGGTATALHAFSPADGENAGGLIQGTDGYLYGMHEKSGPQGLGTIFRVSRTGTNYKTLMALPGSFSGMAPRGSLVQGNDGFYYGMTEYGGEYALGTIFKVCSDGSYTVLRHLDGNNDGGNPTGDLLLGKDGNFYGLTRGGGAHGSGTYFRITPKGDFKVLYSFWNDDTGWSPYGSLVDGGDGYYYGMTNAGGHRLSGVIFRVTPAGNYEVVHSLDNYTDGSSPWGNLVKGKDGNFYGLTNVGGDYNTGTFFRVTPGGIFTKLHSFYQYDHGDLPTGSLVVGKDGNLYGMTARGGKNGYGTIFRFSTFGDLTILKYLTDPYDDGANPYGSLIMDKDGNFYGTTKEGGQNFNGTVFKITPDGKHTILHHFDGATDGRYPFGSLIFQKPNPVAYTQNVTTAVNTAIAITLKGTGGSPLIYEIVSLPKYGTLTGSGSKRIYTPKSNFSGTDSFTYRVNWGCQSSTVKTITIQVGTSVASTIRINAGGRALNTSLGDFSADNYFSGATGISATTSPIASTTADGLYQDNRRANMAEGSFQYAIPVSNGTYTVKLHFAEIYYTAAGQRKFNVTAEGVSWLRNYDIYQAAGGARKAVIATKNVSVTDGTLNLNFISTVDKACVSAIEVLPAIGTEQLVADLPAREDTELISRLYPNPAADKFTVDLQVPAEQITTSIVDTYGTKVRSNTHQVVTADKLEVSVSQLPPGLYSLQVSSNGKQQILRFIKK